MSSFVSRTTPVACATARSYLPLLSSNALSRELAANLRLHVSCCFECDALLKSFQTADDAVRRWVMLIAPLSPSLTLDDLVGADSLRRQTGIPNTRSAPPDGGASARHQPREIPLLPPPDTAATPERERQYSPPFRPDGQSGGIPAGGIPECSLHVYDDPETQAEDKYSRSVAEHFKIVYDRIACASGDGLAKAQVCAEFYNILLHYSSLPMSAHQHLRGQHLLAMSQIAQGNAEAAIATLIEAIVRAEELEDLHALAECAYLTGILLAENGDDTATECFEAALQSLALLQTRYDCADAFDPELEALILQGLALLPPTFNNPPQGRSTGDTMEL